MQKKFSSLFFFICMVNKMFWFCRTWKLNPQGAQRAHPRIMFDEERFLTHLLENNSAFPGEDRSGKVIEKLTFTWNCSSGENASTAKRCGCCVRHAHTYQSQSRKAVASVQRRKMGKWEGFGATTASPRLLLVLQEPTPVENNNTDYHYYHLVDCRFSSFTHITFYFKMDSFILISMK